MLEKNYNPHEVEKKLYSNWEKKKYFHAKADKSKTPYTIMMPPPNITGQLHMGHAMYTIQDVLIRLKRMQGYSALWLPGTDHASIATEIRIIESMSEEGLTKADIGRDGFLKRAWEWNDKYGSRIVEQLKRLGASCDWDRVRFTMDDGLSKAVTEVFMKLYDKGYIYRGTKLTNWCTKCKTTISDAEVDHEDRNGYFWYFKYPVNLESSEQEYLCFATTRPETMLGDTAIAVNPDDERYKHLVGKTVTVPIVNREIPIIADRYVAMDFGTGVVKITPAHDPNDSEVGIRHNLPIINIMNDDGTLNENAGSYAGLDKNGARKRIITEFKELGLYVKEEGINHSVSVHDRCNTVIEPLMKLQWFVKMEEMAKPALEASKNGELRILPERFARIYQNWLENIRDWCISRQLWWGHRIPAYYCDCGHFTVSADTIETCSVCGGKMTQDGDTLDTWFSSALWPFSTLGWPEKTEDLEYFYPTNVLVTAYDIIFFWVARMVFSGVEQTGKLPFRDVLIHGLVRDAHGKKMSKSSDNGIDPLDVIEQYGTDALRIALLSGITPGNDTRFYIEKVESSRNFLNKIWNATRFMLMNIDDERINIYKDADLAADTNLLFTDKWILSRANTVSREVTEALDAYELGQALQKINDFVWDELCDWYIEMIKPRLYNKDDLTRTSALRTLKTVLIKALKLLHPFAPFITEEIFISIQDEDESIMISKWPEYSDCFVFDDEEKRFELFREPVKAIRNIRTEMNVAPSKKTKLIIYSSNEESRKIYESSTALFKSLCFASETVITDEKQGIDGLVSLVITDGIIYLPLAELIDIAKERARLEKERMNITNEISRAEGKLANKGFTDKAPQKLIDEELEKKAKYEEKLIEIKALIDKLN